MIHHLQHISDLVELCHKRGIAHIVASPGSRNAPLIRIFTEHAGFVIHSIVDERSAAYYALGLSLSTNKPIIVLCTSGTAVLNYAPALAEAYYQHIPLIAITADRPEELIDQQDNQTIRQINVYQNFIKSSLHLLRPNLPDYDPGQQNEAIDILLQMADSGIKGPVHINVPLSEPLYGSVPAPSDEIRINLAAQFETGLSACLKSEWKNSTKRIVLCGQGPFDSWVNMALSKLCDGGKAVVMAESIANVKGNMVLQPVERLFMSLDDEAPEALKPDLLISFGGPVVSKRLKDWLQKQKQLSHFRIAPDHETIDTYQNLKGTIIGDPASLFAQLNDLECVTDHRFVQLWHEQKKRSDQRLSTGLKDAEYSDLMVFHHIVNSLPEDCILHLGNSSPVRYAQLFDLKRCKAVYANRGVSGIDGCLSTAAGFAKASDGLNIAVLGDLGFVYDSNALWNRELPKNLRIIVINNQGGGIFRLLPGASDQSGFEKYVEAYHPVDIQKLSSAFGVACLSVDSPIELDNALVELLQTSQGPTLLEIVTPKLSNPVVYKYFVSNMKRDLYNVK